MNLRIFLALLAVVASALVVVPARGWGECPLSSCDTCTNSIDPTGDCDQDGFTNEEECLGLDANQIYADKEVYLTIDGHGTDCLNPPSRSNRLDPATPDLFVILERLGPSASKIPRPGDPDYFNPFEFVEETTPPGLGITVHEIEENSQAWWTVLGNDRKVVDRAPPASPQKAVLVTENQTISDLLGQCEAQWGTPNGLDHVLVFTYAIYDHIQSTCAKARVSGAACADETGLNIQQSEHCPRKCLFGHFVKHVIAHEIGHDIKLTKKYNKRYDGWHYSVAEHLLMSEHVDYRSRKNVSVTWYVGTEWKPQDAIDFVISEQP